MVDQATRGIGLGFDGSSAGILATNVDWRLINKKVAAEIESKPCGLTRITHDGVSESGPNFMNLQITVTNLTSSIRPAFNLIWLTLMLTPR